MNFTSIVSVQTHATWIYIGALTCRRSDLKIDELIAHLSDRRQATAAIERCGNGSGNRARKLGAMPHDLINFNGDFGGALSHSGEVAFQQSLGFFDDAPNFDFYNWSAVDTVKQIYFGLAKRSAVFHYALFANHYSPDRSSGLSRDVPGADFIVTLGDWPVRGGTLMQQAGTFMHEFGHNLGLLHGGFEYTHNKPNYLSIMNYSFQMEGLINANGKRSFDYSRRKLDDLDENNNVNENVGINDPEGHGTLWKTTRPDNPPGSNKCLGAANVNIYYRRFFPPALDWNCDGLQTAAPVAADINGDGAISLLAGFKDWPALAFNGAGKIGNAAGASE